MKLPRRAPDATGLPRRAPDATGRVGPYRYESYEQGGDLRPEHVKAWIWRDGQLMRHWHTFAPRDRLRWHKTFASHDKVRSYLYRKIRKERVPKPNTIPTRTDYEEELRPESSTIPPGHKLQTERHGRRTLCSVVERRR